VADRPRAPACSPPSRTPGAERDLACNPGYAGVAICALLTAWALALTGSQVLYAPYPLLMAWVFHVVPGASALLYAAAVGVSLPLFAPAGA